MTMTEIGQTSSGKNKNILFNFSFAPIQKISAEFLSLLNFGKFGLLMQKRWQKIKKSISQLPTKNSD
jgi:hypothetical protein